MQKFREIFGKNACFWRVFAIQLRLPKVSSAMAPNLSFHFNAQTQRARTQGDEHDGGGL
jgi:hypothetical protein